MRDPDPGLGTQDIGLFRQVVEPLRERTDLLLCLTTSGIPGENLPIEERLAPLEVKPELAFFDAGSINLGGSVFINTPEFLQTAAVRMREKAVKPELRRRRRMRRGQKSPMDTSLKRPGREPWNGREAP